ncbi:MAG TPA: TRAP transporter large permease subunit [Amaricoccus sp.]|uniref:TRAP transporter large permease n=1 Tax=Amaricoccus sp. TaxID=1872485 RepID=UPI002CD061C1|nr:TRAP transporter large permease subunit [Amaricoccus sp.]HMQ92875.1 TRAP transporter large permease subunit [Amaricoccus sp.]HMR52862.1 TRAP transporter large permease subunit [Amaricoccus sp.]HMR60027.1 TRAP transporter large permease subunit [Amaricoccus sp.]HMT99797.1 TRAP transporter large permease subunit [Amaricoccus sp.]
MVDIGTLSLILLIAMFVLLAIGMPLGFASAILAVATLVMKFGPDLLFGDFGRGPLNVLGQAIYRQMTNYVLISIPMFIFMAALLERSGIARDMYSSLNLWLSRTRGGIALVTSIMAVIMAAMSGIIGGEVVLLGLIALPQMLRLGYNRKFAVGTICASGSLGTMIPPSIVLIFYGLITETSIQALFTAAFLPGLMLASFYVIYIVIRSNLYPDQAPLPAPRPEDPSTGEKSLLFLDFLTIIVAIGAAALLLRNLFMTVTGQNRVLENVDPIPLGMVSDLPWIAGTLALALVLMLFVFGRSRTAEAWSIGKGLVAPLVVIGVVLGSIYGGITGITEAAGMGVVAVFVISLLRREMTLEIIWDSLIRTLKSTGTIIWVTIGAAALAAAYTLAGGPTYVANAIIGMELPAMGIIFVMMLIFLVMGMFMDWVGIVLLIMPVFLPIVMKLPPEQIGWLGHLPPDKVAIWFGVTFCMNMQVSFLSPPFGPAAFYLKSVAPDDISLTDIFAGFIPFICIQLLALAVLLIYPPIVTVFL